MASLRSAVCSPVVCNLESQINPFVNSECQQAQVYQQLICTARRAVNPAKFQTETLPSFPVSGLAPAAALSYFDHLCCQHFAICLR